MTASIVRIPARRGIPVWSFADRVRKVRRDMKVTQAKFAAMLDIGEKRYAAWESGINEPEDLPAICVRLQEVTGWPREWFLGWADGSVPPDDGPLAQLAELRTFNPKSSVLELVAA